MKRFDLVRIIEKERVIKIFPKKLFGDFQWIWNNVIGITPPKKPPPVRRARSC